MIDLTVAIWALIAGIFFGVLVLAVILNQTSFGHKIRRKYPRIFIQPREDRKTESPKSISATKKLSPEEVEKRLETAHILQGKLELIVEIQDRFHKGWNVFATAKEWDDFTKPYIKQKV